MDPERRKALQKTQKKCIAAQVVMCAAYISAGILLAVTGRHCVADTPDLYSRRSHYSRLHGSSCSV